MRTWCRRYGNNWAAWVCAGGPQGGDVGGSVATEVTPKLVAQCEESGTGKFLKTML